VFHVIVEYYPCDGHPGLDFVSRGLDRDGVHRFVQRVHERAAAADVVLCGVYVVDYGSDSLPVPYCEFV
jgi:hypothetical protein